MRRPYPGKLIGASVRVVRARTGPAVRYPVSEFAVRYGASVEEETSDPAQVHAELDGSAGCGLRSGAGAVGVGSCSASNRLLENRER